MCPGLLEDRHLTSRLLVYGCINIPRRTLIHARHMRSDSMFEKECAVSSCLSSTVPTHPPDSHPAPSLRACVRALPTCLSRVRVFVNERIHVCVCAGSRKDREDKITSLPPCFTLNAHSYSVISDAVGPAVQPGLYPCDKLCSRLYTNSLSSERAERGGGGGAEVEADGRRRRAKCAVILRRNRFSLS